LYDVPPAIKMKGARVSGLLPETIVAIVTLPALIVEVVASFAYSVATLPNVENEASETLKPLPAVSICDVVVSFVLDTDYCPVKLM
jgi:hypothetical protein